MNIKNSYFVELTKGELRDLFLRVGLDILKKDIPEIETIADKKSINVILATGTKLTGFILVLSGEINSGIDGSLISKYIEFRAVFPSLVVIEEIITMVLEKKNVKKSVDLNTPSTDIEFSLGS